MIGLIDCLIDELDEVFAMRCMFRSRDASAREEAGFSHHPLVQPQ